MASVNLSGQFNPPSFQDTRIEVYAYLVVTSTDVLLIDTGVGEGNEHVERRFEPRRNRLEDQLKRFGVEIGDINLLVNSHLHFDHCGNNRLFPNVETFIQADELAVARSGKYTVVDWFDYPDARINSVAGEMTLCSGISLLATPGHTPGHQSVLVETASGPVLIAAQAAYKAQEYSLGGDVVQAHGGLEEQYLQTISRLKLLSPTAVYFSHDKQVVSLSEVN
jgi:N-acyl homoserine lactone hydrolase